MGGLSYAEFRKDCLEYDPFTPSDGFVYKSYMPTGRSELASATLGGKIYAIGGRNYNGYQRTMEEYDPTTNKWTIKESMQTPRTKFSCAVVNGIIYVFGGRNGNETLASVEAYNPNPPKPHKVMKAMPWIPLLLLDD